VKNVQMFFGGHSVVVVLVV